ncbi:hypothetical protein M426DRAFT_144700 [Hypoxylon sp. CI-4A]|nr:hypothetical protein M426DRAFT_144700 [Hypoxylon sp. CI-4A]
MGNGIAGMYRLYLMYLFWGLNSIIWHLIYVRICSGSFRVLFSIICVTCISSPFPLRRQILLYRARSITAIRKVKSASKMISIQYAGVKTNNATTIFPSSKYFIQSRLGSANPYTRTALHPVYSDF